MPRSAIESLGWVTQKRTHVIFDASFQMHRVSHSKKGLTFVPACRYTKGAWSECDPRTNTRTRTLTLKKGDAATCQQTKTVQKKCKKGKETSVFILKSKDLLFRYSQPLVLKLVDTSLFWLYAPVTAQSSVFGVKFSMREIGRIFISIKKRNLKLWKMPK